MAQARQAGEIYCDWTLEREFAKGSVGRAFSIRLRGTNRLDSDCVAALTQYLDFLRQRAVDADSRPHGEVAQPGSMGNGQAPGILQSETDGERNGDADGSRFEKSLAES
jgi:hypothetical protein